MVPPLFVIAAGWFVGPWWPPVTPPENTGPPIPPVTHRITVAANGSYNPPSITIDAGDTVVWESLSREDTVIPYTANVADPCDPANALAVDEATSFIGPDRAGVPGLFVRAGSGGGGVIMNWPGTCPVVGQGFDTNEPPGSHPDCCDTDPSPGVAGTRAYCDVDSPKELPEEMWGYEGLTGALVIVDWDQIETADQTFDFDTLIGHELDMAADHGKHINLAIKTGEGAVPDSWLFSGACSSVSLKGDNSDDEENSFDQNDCGTAYEAANPFDPDCVAEFTELIDALGTYVKSDGAWRETLSAVLLIGLHIETDEVQVMTTCPDNFMNTCAEGGPASPIDCDPGAGTSMKDCTDAGASGHALACEDGVLDSYTGDDCLCNTYQWAVAGWTPNAVRSFVTAQVETWQDAFWPHITVRYGLKQSGFPAIASATNWSGDTSCIGGSGRNCTNGTSVPLADQTGTDLVPTAVRNDDQALLNSSGLHDLIIADNLAEFGDRFWVMHHGLDPLPMEFPGSPSPSNCSWGGTPDLTAVPPIVTFPIPLVGPVGEENHCPNKWAVNTTLTPPTIHMTGFQTNNPGTINTPELYESSILNLERNTNAIYHEGYAIVAFEAHELGGATEDVTPDREVVGCGADGYDPAMCYSKSLVEHENELVARRDAFAAQAFPNSMSRTFSTPGTYLFYNAHTCAAGVGKAGRVVVQ